MSEATVMENRACFQLKTSFQACTILQITHYDLAQLAEKIPAAVQKAPNFFLGSPVVIDLAAIDTQETLDFARLKEILLTNNLVPVGVSGGNDTQLQDAVTAGFPLITIGLGKAAKTATKTKTPATEAGVPPPSIQPAKIITTPIRSGMSVYAKDADLIVIAPVSAGAELLADGNIHVYGPLRGRALAGVQGNTQARIFCRTLEAELVAIAGYYLVKEDMQNLSAHDGTVQVYLENEQVKIATV
jgi:septum site-determining protein MinC